VVGATPKIALEESRGKWERVPLSGCGYLPCEHPSPSSFHIFPYSDLNQNLMV